MTAPMKANAPNANGGLEHESHRGLWEILYRLCGSAARSDHDIKRIENPKHKVEKQQEFDKMDYYVHKGMIVMIELNNWLRVFGSPEEKQ